LLGLGGDDGQLVAGGAQAMDEFVQEHAVDAVVVGDKKPH
jgi:hypothetical protein